MAKATQDALATLHGAVAQILTNRLESGEATAADISVAVKFLKDNNVTADGEQNAALQSLREKLAARQRGKDESQGNVISLDARNAAQEAIADFNASRGVL